MQISISAVGAVLKQQKREHVKEPFDPYAHSGCERPAPGVPVPIGVRPDNTFMQYSSTDNVFESQDKWDSSVFLDKTHWGYACWPK